MSFSPDLEGLTGGHTGFVAHRQGSHQFLIAHAAMQPPIKKG
jgi:hypothetical protein